MTHHVLLFVRHTMETPWSLGFLSLILIVIPIVGMDLVHKYGWEHWEPFDRGHKQGYNCFSEDLRRSDQRCQFCWNQPPLDVSGGTASYSGVYCQNVRVQKMPHSKHLDKCIVNGVQLSLVERRLWEADAVGSNPITPIALYIMTRCIFIPWNTGRRTGKLLWKEWKMGRQQAQRMRTEIEQ